MTRGGSLGTTIIGVDCATRAANTGIAVGVLRGDRLELTDVVRPDRGPDPVQRVSGLLREHRGRALLALDAPLGWPLGLRCALRNHTAGAPLGVAAADEIFQRHTDRFVRATLGKRPLEVGADRIARTAHAALQFLAEVRSRLQLDVPLAWDPGFTARVAAIEVYPAATLAAHRIAGGPYRKDEEARSRLVSQLRSRRLLQVPRDARLLCKSDHALDAAICVLSGADFLRGLCEPPPDPERAVVEGWIWFRRPSADGAA